MRTRKWIAVVLVFLTLAYCGIAAVVYDHSASVEVYCFADTPALSWAKRHGASISLLGDSEKEHLQYLESFTYTRNDTTCTITGYTGTSTHLVIPEAINGYRVTAVAEHAFDNCSGLQEIVLPKTLQEFAPLHTTQYLLLVYANSSTEQALQQAVSAKEHAEDIKAAAEKAPAALAEAKQEAERLETEALEAEAALTAAKAEDAEDQAQAEALQQTAEEKRAQADAAAKAAEDAQTEADRLERELHAIPQETFTVCAYSHLADSASVNFNNADIPFTYSETGSGVTLVSYTGSSADIIVPTAINGFPVTAISFPVTERTRSILLPPSVAEISSDLTQPRYDAPFWLNLLLVMLGLALALFMARMAEKRGTSPDARFMGIPLIHSGVKYFVLLLLWAAACLAFKWSAVLQNAVGLGLLVLGIVEHVLTLHAVGNAEQIGAQVKEKTDFIRDCRRKAALLQAKAETQPLKESCARVTDALAYCDPVSGEETAAVEAELSAALHRLSRAVDIGDEADAEKQASTLLRLIAERAALQKSAK